MSGYSRNTGANRVAVGEYDEIWIPRDIRTGGAAVILCHGSGVPAEFIDPGPQQSSEILADSLASAGFPCIAGDFGQQTWGNDTAMSRVDSAWSVLKTMLPTINQNKLFIAGVSMGGCVAARYTQLHPTRVAAYLGLIPLLDLVSFYNANVAGSQAGIATAWNVTAPAALPSTADVATNAPLARGVPHLIGYSTADTTVLPGWVRGYAAQVGAYTMVTDTVYGHSDQAVGGMPVGTVAKFLARYA